MKKVFATILLIGIWYIVYNYHNDITRFIMIDIVYHDDLTPQENKPYAKPDIFNYISTTDDFFPSNKQEVLNLFYTALNGGWDNLTFYCENDYDDCTDDVSSFADEGETLSIINNFIPTFNIYNRIYVNINYFGRVEVEFEKQYDEDEQKMIQSKIDTIYAQLINDNMTDREKIRTIHDYIINNTTYDRQRAELVKKFNNINYPIDSNTAYGPLFEGKAICGGYTDVMALFLDKMGILNYKISSENHIWNYVYIDGEWRHLDLTWDDPVLSSGENVLSHSFFLITDEELKKQNVGEHTYNKYIYAQKIGI